MQLFQYPRKDELDAIFRRHSGDPQDNGWRVRMRYWFGYYKPEDWYQAVVDQLVTDDSEWIDVGGGKSIFPHNRPLSSELANRSKCLVGVDPTDNIHQNDLVHERHQAMIEDYETDKVFDLATLRMVAEHIENPEMVVQALAKLTKTNGHVVVYTPYKWSILSLMAWLIPDRFHAFFARIVAPGRKDEDVFPTCYKMNTRKQLRALFEESSFEEVGFAHLDDCVVMRRFRMTYFLELACWKVFQLLHIRYPENNLLAIYRRVDGSAVPAVSETVHYRWKGTKILPTIKRVFAVLTGTI